MPKRQYTAADALETYIGIINNHPGQDENWDAFEQGQLDAALNVLQKQKALNVYTGNDAPPLYFAVQKPGLTKRLLGMGADPNAPLYAFFGGESAKEGKKAGSIFNNAVKFGHYTNETLRLMLAHGANLSLVDDFGNSALDNAARNTVVEALDIFIKEGHARVTRDTKKRFLDSFAINDDLSYEVYQRTLDLRVHNFLEALNAEGVSDEDRSVILRTIRAHLDARQAPDDLLTDANVLYDFIQDRYGKRHEPFQSFLDLFQQHLKDDHPLKKFKDYKVPNKLYYAKDQHGRYIITVNKDEKMKEKALREAVELQPDLPSAQQVVEQIQQGITPRGAMTFGQLFDQFRLETNDERTDRVEKLRKTMELLFKDDMETIRSDRDGHIFMVPKNGQSELAKFLAHKAELYKDVINRPKESMRGREGAGLE